MFDVVVVEAEGVNSKGDASATLSDFIIMRESTFEAKERERVKDQTRLSLFASFANEKLSSIYLSLSLQNANMGKTQRYNVVVPAKTPMFHKEIFVSYPKPTNI